MKQTRVATTLIVTMILTLAVFTAAAAAGPAKGTVTFKTKSGPVVVAVKHAFLVRGRTR